MLCGEARFVKEGTVSCTAKGFLACTKIYKLYVSINYLYSFVSKVKDVMPYVNRNIEQNFQNEMIISTT